MTSAFFHFRRTNPNKLRRRFSKREFLVISFGRIADLNVFGHNSTPVPNRAQGSGTAPRLKHSVGKFRENKTAALRAYGRNRELCGFRKEAHARKNQNAYESEPHRVNYPITYLFMGARPPSDLSHPARSSGRSISGRSSLNIQERVLTRAAKHDISKLKSQGESPLISSTYLSGLRPKCAAILRAISKRLKDSKPAKWYMPLSLWRMHISHRRSASLPAERGRFISSERCFDFWPDAHWRKSFSCKERRPVRLLPLT